MIIISQDRKEIFNFNEIFRLSVDSWSNEEFATEPNCFCIKAEKASDNMIEAFLGEYKTEERAQEIIMEMAQSYLDAENYKYLNEKMTAAQLNNMQKCLIYEMPKE